MISTFRHYVRRLLPEPLKSAIKPRLTAAASRWIHGKPRAHLRFGMSDETGELRIDDTSLTIPQPFATGSSRWLADHPEDVLELEVFLKLAKQADGLMFDIGAHIGVFATLFCKACHCNAIAFEPVPQFQKLIDQMTRLNGVRGRVEVVGTALGNNRN